MNRFTTDENGKIKRPLNPKCNANIFELATYSWMLNLFKTGQTRDLDESDLYMTLDDQLSSSLGDELEKEWRLELTNAYSANRKPSMTRTFVKLFGYKYLSIGFLFALNDIVFKVSRPLLVSGFLAYFNPDGSTTTDLNHAYIYATGIVFTLLMTMILQHLGSEKNLECAMKMRVSSCSLIYRKALRLSQKSLGETTAGKVINLISNDVSRFDIAMNQMHYIWIGPLTTIVVTYFLWQEIGVSSLIGVSAFLFFIPFQYWLGKKISQTRMKTAKMTDKRICLMNEVISGIQVIKMYTWEKPFAKLINYIRKKEIKQIKSTLCLGVITLSFQVVQTRLQLLISLISFLLLGNNISIRKVFVVISFYTVLQQPMTKFFGRGLTQFAELKICLKRIENFMLLEEKDSEIPNILKSDKSLRNEIIESPESEIITENIDVNKKTRYLNTFSIDISNATAKWTDDQTCNTLENINLNILPGSLVTIIGPVGSGKSSLVQVILRELPLSEGKISVHGIVSYASQEPWIFAGTVQQNILFGSPMDEERYKQVLSVCALKTDLKQFQHGDRTLVGERGITLSGGQRARINLARAIYKQADIYLLDDPLSAVDTKVGRHLFEKCIRDLLKKKTCVLITHQVQYLTDVGQIILMDNGSIVAKGSFQELQASNLEFAKSFESPNDTAGINEPENDTNKSINLVSNSLGSNKSISSSHNDVHIKGVPTVKSKNPIKSRSSGSVSINVYLSYLSAGGSVLKVFFVLLCFVLTQVLTTGGDYWISFWANLEQKNTRYTKDISNGNGSLSSSDLIGTLLFTSNFRQDCIIVYTVIIIFSIINVIVRCITYTSFCMRTSINVHNQMFDSFIKTTMWFFNNKSSGDMLNRFTKDIGTVDEFLPFVIMDCLQLLMLFLGIIFIVGYVNIYLMVPAFIVVIISYYLRVFYLPTSRGIKKIEGVTRSPVFAHMKETLQGITTIRSCKVEQILINEFDKHQDLHSSAWDLLICATQAFGIWLDLFCVVFIGIVIFSFFGVDKDDFGGNVGLTITQTISLTSIIQWGVRQISVLENQMTSFERVLEYTDLPQEADFRSLSEKTPPEGWPFLGKIEFRNFNLRYDLDSPYVLKNLNVQIQPMEKVGIVGRTGAGKSSFIGAMFRFALNEGSILIDNIEIHDLGLHDLRSKFSIIPQEPVLFSGTMRSNLDPFDEYPDRVLWNALDEVELKTVAESFPAGLNSKISAFGSNFSVGQRQLLCLARAIIRNNKIIILDEATANVDPQTDALIQNTIKNKFKSCTVLTIAHRLNTIMDSERVLVMDAGTVVEFDHPHNLLKNKDGFLYKMVEQTGIITSELLHSMASKSFDGQAI